MAEAVKISDLPSPSSVGPEDILVINDVTSADEITSKFSLGSLVDWITDQELVFSKPIQISEIVPHPEGFNVTVTSIHVDEKLSLGPFGVLEGIELDDLDDVTIDDQMIVHGHTLMWDSAEGAWVNDFLNIDNADDEINANIEELRDSIDMLMDSINAKVDPAPSDGGYYVMQNGVWVDITQLLTPFTKYLVYDGGVDPT